MTYTIMMLMRSSQCYKPSPIGVDELRYILIFANAARRDAGFFNVFLLRSYFLWVVWVGGWGDVNVPWKRYVTYAGVGVGGVG